MLRIHMVEHGQPRSITAGGPIEDALDCVLIGNVAEHNGEYNLKTASGWKYLTPAEFDAYQNMPADQRRWIVRLPGNSPSPLA